MLCITKGRVKNLKNLVKPKAYPPHSVLQYTLPIMKQATNEVSEDLPLFVKLVLGFFINIYKLEYY